MACEKINFMLTGVPPELVAALEKRAENNFRSRNGEVLSILTSVCCGRQEPDSGSTGVDVVTSDRKDGGCVCQ